MLDLAAAESASQDSRAIVLALEQEFERQRLRLNKMLGVGPETHVRLRPGLMVLKNRNYLPVVAALN